MRTFVLIGSLSAFTGVGLGAFGAHGLQTKVSPAMLSAWQTGVQYHLIHALGLLLVGILCHLRPSASRIRTSGWLLLIGICLFSGSLYLMVLFGIKALGVITPLGGLAFLTGWLLLAFAVRE